MAKDTMSTLLTVGLVGGAGYLAWEWWTSQSAASTAISPGTTTTPPTQTTAIGAPAPTGTPAPNPPAAPSYSGPSLDSMYSQLVAAAILGMQNGDTSVTCPGGAGISGLGIVQRRPVAAPETAASGSPSAAGTPAPRVATCNTPYANPDVWNWYLVNRTQSGISSAPDPTVAFPGQDRTVPITAAAYWAGVSPIISHSLGLSGLGAFGHAFRGLGRYWGLGDGDSVTLSIPGQVSAPVDTTASDYAAIVAAMAQNPNYDTNQGSYSTDPTTGQTVFTPPPTPKATGVSTPMIVLGAGAALLLIGIGSGIRH